jgi:hypothetical protein
LTTFAFAGPNAGDDQADNCDPEPAPHGEADTAWSDSDKAVVISYVKQLVDGGEAVWRRLSNGDVELCLASGELFLLGEENITRLS